MKNDIFPDWLPPALVKDWRQMLRSPLYLLGVLAAVLVALMVTLRSVGEDVRDVEGFWLLQGLLLCCMVPARVGLAVETELKNAGGVFLRLTPLSSRQVVWGTWFSGMVQVLLLALLAIPLVILQLGAFQGAELVAQAWGYAAGLTLLVALGGVLVAASQATASQPILLRVLCGMILAGYGVCEAVDMAVCFRTGLFIGNVVLMGLMLMMSAAMVLTLLEEARRPFAHPAENCTASVRRCSLLAFVVYLAGMVCGLVWDAYTWPVLFVMLMAVWGMLQPEKADAAPLQPLRWLPGCLQGRGLWGGSLWLCTVCFLCMLAMLPVIWLQWGEHDEVDLQLLQRFGFDMQTVALLGARYWLSLLVSLLAALLFSSLIAPRSRAVVFVLVLLVELFLGFVFNVFALLSGQENLWTFLPLLPVDFAELSNYLMPEHWNRQMVEESVLWIIAVKAAWLAVLLPVSRFLDRRR